MLTPERRHDGGAGPRPATLEALEGDFERRLPGFFGENRRLFRGADEAALGLLATLIERIRLRERGVTTASASQLAPAWLAAATASRWTRDGTLEGALALLARPGEARPRGWNGLEVVEPARGLLEFRRAGGRAAVLAILRAPSQGPAPGAGALPRASALPPGTRLYLVELEKDLPLRRPHHGLRVSGRLCAVLPGQAGSPALASSQARDVPLEGEEA